MGSLSPYCENVGASKPTVYKWVDRYERFGVDGLTDLPRSGRPAEVPDSVRSRIVALTRCTPPAETGLSHWSSLRKMATYLKRAEGIAVSHNFIAQVWRIDRSAAPAGQLQAVGRSGLRGQGGRCGRALPGSPGGCSGVVDRREDPGAGPLDRTQPVLPIDFAKPRSAPTTTCATAPRTCSPRWTPSPDTCSDSATSGGAPRSFSRSWTPLPHGTATTRSMSSWTTCRPTRACT